MVDLGELILLSLLLDDFEEDCDDVGLNNDDIEEGLEELDEKNVGVADDEKVGVLSVGELVCTRLRAASCHC